MAENMIIAYGEGTLSTCEECSSAIRKEMSSIATGFVRIGYLLRMARDTGIVEQGGYKNMEDYARQEFNMDKSAVSRFIRINEKYSEGGYSDKIQARYERYSYSNLSELLTLPEDVAAVIPPEYTREQIREIKKEIVEEQNITDIEIMAEPEQRAEINLDNSIKKVLYAFFENEENLDTYERLWRVIYKAEGEDIIKGIQRVLAPTGNGALFARVPQAGKVMVNIYGTDRNIVLLNTRSGDSEEVTWEQMEEAVNEFMILSTSPSIEEDWSSVYGKEYPRTVKKEIAKKPINSHAESTSKVEEIKAEKPVESLAKEEEKEVAPAPQEENETVSEEKEPETVINSYAEEEFENRKEEPVVEDNPYIAKAEEYASGLLQYIKAKEWQQAIWCIHDLNDLIVKMREREKKVDIPGQMSFGGEEDEE